MYLKQDEVRLVLKEAPGIYVETVNCSGKIADIFYEGMRTLDRETVWSLNLDSKLRPLGYHVVSLGGIDSAPVEMANIFKSAILSNARYIALAHNHPSGNPTPSQSDIEQTKRIRSACGVMDVSFVDHIILAEDNYFSFADERTRQYQPLSI